MGLSLSLHISPWKEFLRRKVLDLYDVGTLLVRSYGGMDAEMNLSSVSVEESDSGTKLKSKKTMVIEQSLSFKNWEPEKCKLEITLSFKKKGVNNEKFDATDSQEVIKSKLESHICEFTSPKPTGELDAAAVKVQKVYKSYRTRRNLADCAVVVEELWWKALDSAALKQSSVSFFDIKRPETAVSRWSRARTRAAKVGKGLSKDEKAQKLALQHWLEAIDPRHRYGHNLHYYYDIWFDSESTQPFFYWLDIGDGKEVDLETCARIVLQRQCIKYLGPKEREAYEVTVDNGRLVYRQSRMFVNTSEGSKWIFVLSTSRALYVGQKKKGTFQHSSFLSGGATTAAGRLVSENGVLKAIWPYSGHYLPTEENFKEFIIFLEEHDVDLSNVKKCATDDDSPPCKAHEKPYQEEEVVCPTASDVQDSNPLKEEMESVIEAIEGADGLDNNVVDAEAPTFHLGKPLSCKWSTGNGPRIGIVRDYPADLQFRALEQVNLSPKVTPGLIESCGPIPSPRPSPKVRLSPRLAYMGHPSPRVTLPSTKLTLPIHSLAK